MPPSLQSMVLLLTVRDGNACRHELDRQRTALEAAWAQIPGLHSACFALLPADDPATPEAALLFECTFDGLLLDFAPTLYQAAGRAFDALFAHTGAPPATDAGAFYRFLSANARRTAAFSTRPQVRRRLWIALDWLRRLAASRAVTRGSALNPEALEARRAAVGMQERAPGVPTLHVALIAPEATARARLKRALRELEFGADRAELTARFLIAGERLVCLAYPDEIAPLWSERMSATALADLSSIWANTRGFVASTGLRRRRRERRLEEFLLDYRVPAGAWFCARARLGNA